MGDDVTDTEYMLALAPEPSKFRWWRFNQPAPPTIREALTEFSNRMQSCIDAEPDIEKRMTLLILSVHLVSRVNVTPQVDQSGSRDPRACMDRRRGLSFTLTGDWMMDAS